MKHLSRSVCWSYTSPYTFRISVSKIYFFLHLLVLQTISILSLGYGSKSRDNIKQIPTKWTLLQANLMQARSSYKPDVRKLRTVHGFEFFSVKVKTAFSKDNVALYSPEKNCRKPFWWFLKSTTITCEVVSVIHCPLIVIPFTWDNIHICKR